VLNQKIPLLQKYQGEYQNQARQSGLPCPKLVQSLAKIYRLKRLQA
jgi:hypothetical protein